MSKLIDIAVKSKTAPKDTNCLWYDETVNRLKIFDSNGWRTISGGGEGSAGVSSINGVEGDILLKNIGGQSIIGGGNIEFPTVATTSKAGLVKPGNGLSVSPTGALNLNTASTNTFGGVKVDGVTIKINNGIISAEGGRSSPTEETLIDLSDMSIRPFTPTDITDRIPENFKPSHLTQLKITGTESDEDGNPIIYTYCNCDLIKMGNEYCLLFNALFNIERIAYWIKPDNNKWVVMKFEEFS